MIIQIIYALVVSLIYLAFNYDLEKTIEEQRSLFTLSAGVFVGSLLLFYMIQKPSESYGSEYTASEISGSGLPFPE